MPQKHKILRILATSYTNLKAKVRVSGNNTSNDVTIARSVRQGGVLSSFYYLVYINKLLLELELSRKAVCVNSIQLGNPAFADDIALIALSPFCLQSLLDIVYEYCQTWHMDINVGKSVTVVYST